MNGKITEEGVFLEQLETNPFKYLPEVKESEVSSDVVSVSMSFYIYRCLTIFT